MMVPMTAIDVLVYRRLAQTSTHEIGERDARRKQLIY
jgi:hypothetical protein